MSGKEIGFVGKILKMVKETSNFTLPEVDEKWQELPIMDKIAIMMFYIIAISKKHNFSITLTIIFNFFTTLLIILGIN